MDYRVYTPQAALLPYVKCYWSLDSGDTPFMPGVERVFPDGCIELLFHYGDRFRKYLDDAQTVLHPRSFIHGQIRSYIDLEPTGTIGLFSVRFQPAGLQAFVPMQAGDLSGLTVEPDSIWGPDGDVLQDRMLNASSHTQRIQIIEAFLRQRLRRNSYSTDAIAYCIQQLHQSGGQVSMETLAEKANMGRRHLERRFVSGVGMSPKLLSRIIRFQNMLRLIGENRLNSLTALAYEGGYYDQAHFIKDFREFTGLNPRAYFSENLAMARFLSSE
ncbi:MAG: AraC family transcriptional regulator [Flavobacteriales bacterium]